MLEHPASYQANPYPTIAMKVRAYLAEGEECLVPKTESESHKDFNTATSDMDELYQLISLFFPGQVIVIGEFDNRQDVEEEANQNDLVYRQLQFEGPGIYCLWNAGAKRQILRSDILLEREMKFFFSLDENISSEMGGKSEVKAEQI